MREILTRQKIGSGKNSKGISIMCNENTTRNEYQIIRPESLNPNPTGIIKLPNDIVEKIKTGNLRIVSNNKNYNIIDADNKTILHLRMLPHDPLINTEIDAIYKKYGDIYSPKYEVSALFDAYIGKDVSINQENYLELPDIYDPIGSDKQILKCRRDILMNHYKCCKMQYFATRDKLTTLLKDFQSETINKHIDNRSVSLRKLQESILQQQTLLEKIEFNLVELSNAIKQSLN